MTKAIGYFIYIPSKVTRKGANILIILTRYLKTNELLNIQWYKQEGEIWEGNMINYKRDHSKRNTKPP